MSNVRVTDEQLKLIRNRLSPAYSSLFVYGMGCDTDLVPDFDSDPIIASLLSGKADKTREWKTVFSMGAIKPTNDFFMTLIAKMADAPSFAIENATKYVLKTSIAGSIDKLKTERGFCCLELNGCVNEGLDGDTNLITQIDSVEQITDRTAPTFPTGNYDSKKKMVKKFESAYEYDFINIALFLGSSGRCVVTESLFNRALVNKTLIVVVNRDKDCYMHDLATVSIVGDVNLFFDDLNRYYKEN